MSRTYRRKEGFGPGYQDKKWYCDEWVHQYGYHYILIPLDPTSDEYRKKSAKYHSDANSHNFKEPGPRWWRNMRTNRPLRRDSDREIRKYMLNEEYEVVIDTKGKRPYWT